MGTTGGRLSVTLSTCVLVVLGTSLGVVISAMVMSCTATVDPPGVGVGVGGASVTGGGMVLWFVTGDAVLGVMVNSVTSVAGRLLYLSWLTMLFVTLGEYLWVS